MIAARNFSPMTPDEYFEWEDRQELRYEYFDGEIFGMAGGSVPHNAIAVNITTALKSRLRGKGCMVLNSDGKLAIAENGPYTYLDISVTCDDRDRTAKNFCNILR
jgi:Uma2 family endonuclease